MSRPLDALDYERRDWMPWSGWPIGWDTLEPYHADTAKLLELDEPRFELDVWRDRIAPRFALDGSNFENVIYQYSPETNFGSTHGARLLQAPMPERSSTRVLRALSWIPTPAASKPCVLPRCRDACSAFVPRPAFWPRAASRMRLLLASRRDRPACLGNEYDLVGRFFMDHLHESAGHMVAAREARDRDRLPATLIGIGPASFSFGTQFCGWPPPVTFGPIRVYRALRHARFEAVVETLKVSAERASRARLRWQTWNAARAALAGAQGLTAEAQTTSGPLYALYLSNPPVQRAG
jgi:hypothetical protein